MAGTENPFAVVVEAMLSISWCDVGSQWLSRKPAYMPAELATWTEGLPEGFVPLNRGALMMASFACFVMPQQDHFDTLDFSKCDRSKFTVQHDEEETASQNTVFFRRLRNSLAHSRFHFSESDILFEDGRPAQARSDFVPNFRARCALSDFGGFLQSFALEAKRQFYEAAE